MMYQLPLDMMTRIAIVAFDTMSPPAHNACRPYGFSTISVVRAPPDTAAGVGGGAGLSGAESWLAAGAAGEGDCACASAATGTSTAGMAMSSTMAHAAKRVILIIIVSKRMVVRTENCSGPPMANRHPACGSTGRSMLVREPRKQRGQVPLRQRGHREPRQHCMFSPAQFGPTEAQTHWPRRGAGPSSHAKVAGFYTKPPKSAPKPQIISPRYAASRRSDAPGHPRGGRRERGARPVSA